VICSRLAGFSCPRSHGIEYGWSEEYPVALMENTFRIGLVVGVLAIAIAVFQHSQNGRYQYSTDGTHGTIVDTRTGEYWTEDGSHFEPRTAHITARHPSVDDQTASDDKSNKFKECLEANILAVRAHSETRRDCVAEQKFDFQPDSQLQKSDPAKR